MNIPRPPVLVVLAAVAGMVIATVLGLLTFGVQSTVEPDGLPVAVAVPADGPAAAGLRQAAEQVTGHGGDQVAWRITDPERARELLDDKEVYGVLELAPADSGVAATVVVSGAVNPSGSQVAQQLLTAAGQGAVAAQSTPGSAAQPVEVTTVHPASAAGRSVPLAASALLWIAGLVASALITVLPARAGLVTSTRARLATAVGVTLTGTSAVLGLIWLWDSSLRMDAKVIGFLALVGFAFACLQGAVLRLLGLPGLAILGPLYLMAPAVSGQVPELLHPAYRVALWSWSPFRFSTEGLRSLLFLDSTPPDVPAALWVFGGIAVVGLVVLLWPGRRRQPQRPDAEDPGGTAAEQGVSAAA